MVTDKVDQAFTKFAENGWFSKDPKYRYDYGEHQYADKPECWYIQFTAYDGYHVAHTCSSEKEADAVLMQLNSFKDAAKCRAYLNELQNGDCTLIHSLKVSKEVHRAITGR